jgi:hypothetical protein
MYNSKEVEETEPLSGVQIMVKKGERGENVSAKDFIETYVRAKSLSEFQKSLQKLNDREWSEAKISARIASLRTDKKLPIPTLAERQQAAGQKVIWCSKEGRQRMTAEELQELIPQELQKLATLRKPKEGT